MRLWTVVLAIAIATGTVAAHQDRYPMPAAEYRKKADARLARYKERIEQHMTEQKLAETTRAAVRKRLGVMEQEMRALVEKRAGDGTITLAEADEVKQLGKVRRDAIYREFKIAADHKKPKKKS
jgi:hypothetical protein